MSFRYNLEHYLLEADQGRIAEGVVHANEHCLVIRDLFPKGQVHYLVMPRSKEISRKKNLSGILKEAQVRKDLQPSIEWAAAHAAEQLRLKTGLDIRSCQQMIMIGIHSIPTFWNIHIHIISKDLTGERMDRLENYNSFATSFFVTWDQLATLEDDDYRLNELTMLKMKKAKPKCIWCKQVFGSYPPLRSHLRSHLDHFIRKKRLSIDLD